MRVTGSRAAAILENLLRSRQDPRPYLIPANVCPVVIEAFEAAGQPYECIDIAGDDLALDRDLARRRLERGSCGGIVFVRTYGFLGEVDFQELKELQPDLLVIDDRCLCRPDWQGSDLSPGADVTLYSTGYAKYVDLGFGGFAHLEAEIAYAASFQRDDYGILLARALPEADEHKRRLNAVYQSGLPAEIQFPSGFHGWRFQIRVPGSARLLERLKDAGLFASRHYPPLGDFPVARELHRTVVNLFNDRYYSEEQARTTCEIVRAHLI
jgi:hypothetical protein